MSSNPSSLPLAATLPLSLLSSPSAALRLPLTVDRARAVIDTTLALLRAVQRDPGSSLSTTDGRFLSCRDSLRALHLEVEGRWFDSQLETGNEATAATAVSTATKARKPRGARKSGSALDSSPLGAFAGNTVDTPGLSSPVRSSLLTIAAPMDTQLEPLGSDDIPDMPGEERV